MTIKVQYLDKKITKLQKTEKGDCIDLRVSNVESTSKSYYCEDEYFSLSYKKGDVVLIKFGVAIQVDKDKRINLYARSSTFKNFGLILTNGVGIIDNSFSSSEDEICGMFYALRDGCISYNDRVAQFEVVDRMIITNNDIIEVESLKGSPRGSYGSTGVQ